ncbi:hypothetical protein CEXT_606361 [Caerostris extrusa]|uniref:Uncharacterized protein n=1 Tax=Caerostris extrusa TaxID=172846 RepID=A0AAV4RIW3_CAEEX|nr:hypothetical protein CEXT_606361 [Caerostris extrusa]
MGAILTAIEGSPFVGVQCSLATSVCIMEGGLFKQTILSLGSCGFSSSPKERFLGCRVGLPFQTASSFVVLLCYLLIGIAPIKGGPV